MARTVKTSITLSPEAHAAAVMLAKLDRMQHGSEATISSVVDGLLIAAQPKKRIERAYDGKTFVGYNGFYGNHQVAYEEKTEIAAQMKVDQYAYEEAKL